jgi:plasmid stabilization system protein ParE
MSRRLRFSRAAESEYHRSVEWYEQRQPGLGERFHRAVADVLLKMALNPKLFRAARYRAAGRPVRRAIVRGFPFTIHFIDLGEEIVVMAVFHASRDPQNLLMRPMN